MKPKTKQSMSYELTKSAYLFLTNWAHYASASHGACTDLIPKSLTNFIESSTIISVIIIDFLAKFT